MITLPDWLQNIDISNYDYNLPDERIAKYPVNERDQSKLLIYKKGAISESRFVFLDKWLPKESLLVFNNTRVIPARINFKNETGADIEVLCLEPVNPKNYLSAFQSHTCTWKCMVGNLKKWKSNELYKTLIFNDNSFIFTAKKTKSFQSYQHIEFSWYIQNLSFGEIIELAGVTPIPPYLNRKSELIDYERYQTVYSQIKGSVASPTAGLHFTDNLLASLHKHHITSADITLHVGAGTFKPVKPGSISNHEMHAEFFTVSIKTIQQIIQKYGKIIAVGTTSLRTIESLYWLAHKIKNRLLHDENRLNLNQWDSYNMDGYMTFTEALYELSEYMEKNNLSEISATTQIMIVPGYKIQSIRALITNFHQPKSTLLLLLSAVTGNNWKTIYNYALENNFRFLSYGDSSLIYIDD